MMTVIPAAAGAAAGVEGAVAAPLLTELQIAINLKQYYNAYRMYPLGARNMCRPYSGGANY